MIISRSPDERLATIAVTVGCLVDLKVIFHNQVLKIIDELNKI